jgi:MscS family membrane protein
MNQLQDILFNEGFLVAKLLHLIIIFTIGIILNIAKNRFINKVTHNQNLEQLDNYGELFFFAAKTPASFCIWFVTVIAALNVFSHISPDHIVFYYRYEILKIGLVFTIVWAMHVFILKLSGKIVEKKIVAHSIDNTSVLALIRLILIILYLIVALTTLPILGIPISGLLTVGGIGGLAIGFASKEIIANLLAGMMLYVERPFSVGDAIESTDGKIQGTVLDIDWRNTKIKCLDRKIIFVPNSNFSTMNIINSAKRTHREIDQIIGIRFEDAAKLPEVILALEAMLKANQDVDQYDTIYVGLDKYGNNSLDIKLWCFSKRTNMLEFLEFKHNLLMDILAVLKQQGVEMAYPTSMVYLQSVKN